MVFTSMEEEYVDKDMMFLLMASRYAKKHSGCTKVSVGSCIVQRDRVIAFGANRAVPDDCRSKGCLRIEKYGENSKAHRNPEDCRAIHSEIDAICQALQTEPYRVKRSTIYVTRYPCESCARAIIAAGIKRVVYGRDQIISELTQRMFDEAGVECINYPDFHEEDTAI